MTPVGTSKSRHHFKLYHVMFFRRPGKYHHCQENARNKTGKICCMLHKFSYQANGSDDLDKKNKDTYVRHTVIFPGIIPPKPSRYEFENAACPRYSLHYVYSNSLGSCLRLCRFRPLFGTFFHLALFDRFALLLLLLFGFCSLDRLWVGSLLD